MPQAAPQKPGQPPQNPKVLDELDRPAKSAGELRQLLARPSVIEQIKLTLPKHMEPERLSKIMLSMVLQTPKLMQVNMLSLIQTLTKLSEIGLEPGSAFGHVYLVPFENTQAQRVDVQIIIGYKGLLELTRRSGFVSQLETHVVYEDEVFELTYGFSDVRKLRHVPELKKPRKGVRAYAVYLLARLKDGSEHFEIMPMDEVEGIRDNTQAFRVARSRKKPPSGPWVEHFNQMARKTVIRRACNYLPLSPQMAEALELEDASEERLAGSASTITKQGIVPEGFDIADAMSSRPPAEEPQTAPEVEETPHDPATGEVTEAESTPAAAEQEPDKGTVEHLIWRVAKASTEQLAELIQEAASLSKEEPRRMDVSKAISKRREELRG